MGERRDVEAAAEHGRCAEQSGVEVADAAAQGLEAVMKLPIRLPVRSCNSSFHGTRVS
jgi:hypothetical protein